MYDKGEIKNLEYNVLIKLINTLTTDEIIKVSNQVGYPVFTRFLI